MPRDEFNFYPVAARTRNFLITYDDSDGDAINRALAIAKTCEDDLSRLEQLFSTKYQSGVNHKYGNWVHVQAYVPGVGGASNYGFDDDNSPRIFIAGRYVPPPPEPPSIIPPDPPLPPAPNVMYISQEAPRMLFVAELAEILMDFTGYGWNRGASNGEALSILLATLLHPTGYYGPGWGPRVGDWLNSNPRHDFVAVTDSTDKNRISYGCGVLFLYYLSSQLGYGLKHIISAGGGNLAETYSRLTGKPFYQAFTSFTGLIARHLPSGIAATVEKDNLFPLCDPPGRQVFVSTDWRMMSTRTDPHPHQVELRAGFICAPKVYNYWIVRELLEFAATATCKGYINASFRWTVNGIDLPVRGAQGFADIPAVLTTTTPDKKTTTVGTILHVTYVIRDYWNRSTLFFQNLDFGNCDLEIGAYATESAMNDGVETGDDSESLTCVYYQLEDQYWEDRRRCNPIFYDLDGRLTALVEELVYLRNLPDPPPDQGLKRVMITAQRANAALSRAAAELGQSEKQILHEFDIPGALWANSPEQVAPKLPMRSVARHSEHDRGGS